MRKYLIKINYKKKWFRKLIDTIIVYEMRRTFIVPKNSICYKCPSKSKNNAIYCGYGLPHKTAYKKCKYARRIK